MLRSGAARKIVLGVAIWVVALTAAHFALNVDWSSVVNSRLPLAK
jgi:hypothetical protein